MTDSLLSSAKTGLPEADRSTEAAKTASPFPKNRFAFVIVIIFFIYKTLPFWMVDPADEFYSNNTQIQDMKIGKCAGEPCVEYRM